MKLKLKLMTPFLLSVTANNIAAITLFPFGIYFKSKRNLSNIFTVNHEKIHWKQQVEMFILGIIISLIVAALMIIFNWSLWWIFFIVLFPFLFFYIEYAVEWIFKVILPPPGAYRNLAAEREAYKYDKDFDYLKRRKPFRWLLYIFKEP